MRLSRQDDGFDRIATFDIETTAISPEDGETVSIGVGVHERGTPGADAEYELLHRSGDDEAALIEQAFRTIEESDVDALVSYNGSDFDMGFLAGRLTELEASVEGPDVEPHVDLFVERKAVCGRTGRKWPKLEECLATYNRDPASTFWNDMQVTNAVFGDQLGPAYLNAVASGDDERVEELLDVLEHYLVTDLEANFAIYYDDVDVEFEAAYLGANKKFEA